MKCKFCKVELESHYHYDINEPIGLCIDDETQSKRSPDYLWCNKCGLMYKELNLISKVKYEK